MLGRIKQKIFPFSIFTDMGWFKRKTAVSSSPIEKVMEVSLDNAPNYSWVHHIFFLHI